MMIKSALITTATQMAGAANQLPFAAGSGLVNPNAAMNPGLVFDSTPAEWLAFVCGTGEIPAANCTAAGVTPINPTDLNAASIAVSRATESLPYTVTRRVTNVGGLPAVYTATLSAINGFTAPVNPSTLQLDPGETESFTVTLTRTGTAAPFDVYQFGALTLTDGAHNVRVPIAVKAVQLSRRRPSPAMPRVARSRSTRSRATPDRTGGPHGLVVDSARLAWCRRPERLLRHDAGDLTTQPGVSFHDSSCPLGCATPGSRCSTASPMATTISTW